MKASHRAGAVNRVHMEDVVFEHNAANDFGGAIEVNGQAELLVPRCCDWPGYCSECRIS